MTFLDIQTLTKNRINEIEQDDQIDIIIKNAINYAYLLFATKVDKRTKTAILTGSSTLTLPTDYASMIELFYNSRPLSKLDYDLEADALIIRSSDVSSPITILYVYYPTRLVSDSDTMNLKDIYCIATSIYAAYMYYTYKKRADMAQLLYSELNSIVNMSEVIK